MDTLVGPCADEVASDGDPAIRDRDGNWTYLFAVVVDDLRQAIDLVVRGRDLLAATPTQIRLGRLLGREVPPTYAAPSAGPPPRRPQAVEGERATRRCATCGRPGGPPPTSSARRPRRSG